MDTTSNQPNPESREQLLRKYGLRELTIQSENRDHLDNKTGVILGFALVAVVEILGLLLLGLVERPLEHVALLGPHRVYLLVLTVGGVASVVVCVLFCIMQLRPMDFHYVDMDFLEQIQKEVPIDEIKRRLESRISECAYRNSEIVEEKSRLATWAAIFAGISILLFAGGVVVTLFLILR
jgi:hypothetical protein